MSGTSTPALSLIVQGALLAAGDASTLAALCGARELEQIDATAWRLRGARRSETIAAFCAQHSLDHAWVPEGKRFADFGLLAMDMDSTLITIECID